MGCGASKPPSVELPKSTSRPRGTSEPGVLQYECSQVLGVQALAGAAEAPQLPPHRVTSPAVLSSVPKLPSLVPGSVRHGTSTAGEGVPSGTPAPALPQLPPRAPSLLPPIHTPNKIAAAEEPSDPLATTRLGVTLRGLLRIKEQLVARFGQETFSTMSTADVNMQWVEVVTEARRCRLLEIPELVDPWDVRPPLYFISHTWKNRASRLLDYVLGYLQDAGDGVSVWLDVLCVNQHEETEAHQCDVAPATFSAVVQACGGGTIVVLDSERCSPATRAWCIFEWAHTLALHGPDGLHLHLRPEDRAAVFASIDVERAECFRPDDKVMIMHEVRKHHTSAARFNARLKLQLLLEPLSYRVDVRRLHDMAAATGTVWDFTAVQAWRALPPGGAGRVLCVAAGAGEGKSTISAALCVAAGGGRVAAQHFLKYNDQRRLEPLRIIKSLAFQLAERLPAVSGALLCADAASVALMTDVEEAFVTLLLRPLEAHYQDHQQQQQHQHAAQLDAAQQQQDDGDVVLLLDALDEADPGELQRAGAAGPNRSSSSNGHRHTDQEGGAGGRGGYEAACPTVCGNRALQLVVGQLSRLPPCVRFVFTTRPDAAAGQVLPCLERTFPGGVTILKPSELRKPSGDGGVGAGGGGSGGGGGGGVMVYHTAAAACRDAGQRVVELPAPQLSDVYDLYGSVFEASYRKYGGPEQAALAADLLAVLMAAREPLSVSFLQQLGVGSAVPLLPGYPRLFFLDEHHLYTVHKSLGDWLLDPALSRRWAVDVRRGHERIGEHLASTWRSSSGSGGGGAGGAAAGMTTSTLSYTLKYAIEHLVEAAGGAGAAGITPREAQVQQGGGAAAAVALDALLSDFVFVRAVLDAGHGPAMIGALGAMQQHTTYSYDALRWLRSELYNLYGKTVGGLVDNALVAAPWTTQLYRSASTAAGQPYATCLALPRGGWPECQAVLKGHHNAVTGVTYGPDGRQLVSAGSDGQVRVWEAATGQCSAVLHGHEGAVHAVAFRSDGRQLATGGADNTVRIWDAATGQCTAALQGHDASVTCLAFPPSGAAGQGLASGSHDGTVRMWDTDRGGCTAVLQHGQEAVHALSCHPSGRWLASGGADGVVRVWAVAAGRVHAEVVVGGGPVFCVAISPDGTELATGGQDGQVRLWDWSAKQCTALLQGHEGAVLCLSYSSDGACLASGSGDKAVRIWCRTSGAWACTSTLQGHGWGVNGVAISPDGRQLASGSRDTTVRLWDLEAGDLHSNGAAATAAARSAAGASGAWEAVGQQQDQGHTDVVYGVAYNPDGALLASGGLDGTVRLWDASTGCCTAVLRGHSKGVSAVAFGPGGRLLASGSRDSTLRMWEVGSGRCTTELQAGGQVFSVAFRPDGKQLAAGCGDAAVRLYDIAKAQCTSVLQGHGAGNAVYCLAYSPNGKLLASGCGDATVRLWSVSSGQCTASLPCFGWAVFSVAFSPDGSQLATGSQDSPVRLWDLAAGACKAVLHGHADVVQSLSYSTDGKRLASGSGDKTVRLWELAGGESATCTGVLRGHARGVYGVAWRPGASGHVASCSGDRTVRVWGPASCAAGYGEGPGTVGAGAGGVRVEKRVSQRGSLAQRVSDAGLSVRRLLTGGSGKATG